MIICLIDLEIISCLIDLEMVSCLIDLEMIICLIDLEIISCLIDLEIISCLIDLEIISCLIDFEMIICLIDLCMSQRHLEPKHLRSSPLFTFSTKLLSQDSPSVHLFSIIIGSRFTAVKIKLGEDSPS